MPLRFQVTKYDCGTVSLFNAFIFLFKRNEILAEFVRDINAYNLDFAIIN